MTRKRNAAGPRQAGGAKERHGRPDDIAPGADAKARRPRDPFDIAREEWLARCNRHTGLPLGCFKVLYRICNHASVRESGYSWFSLARKAADTAMSITAVRRAEAAAVCQGLLLVISDGDRRRPSQCWPLLDGKPLAGTLPDLPAALRPKMAVVEKRDRSTGKFTTAIIGVSLRPLSAPDYGHFRRTTLLTDSLTDPVTATTAESLRLRPEDAGPGSKEEERKKPDRLVAAPATPMRATDDADGDDLAMLREQAAFDLKRWQRSPEPFAELVARGSRDRLEAAEAKQRSAREGAPPTPAPPKASAKKRSQAESDQRRATLHAVTKALGVRVALTATCPWLADEIEQLMERRITLEALLTACRRAREAGNVPADLRALKQSGGLTTLIDRYLDHAPSPTPSTTIPSVH